MSACTGKRYALHRTIWASNGYNTVMKYNIITGPHEGNILLLSLSAEEKGLGITDLWRAEKKLTQVNYQATSYWLYACTARDSLILWLCFVGFFFFSPYISARNRYFFQTFAVRQKRPDIANSFAANYNSKRIQYIEQGVRSAVVTTCPRCLGVYTRGVWQSNRKRYKLLLLFQLYIISARVR